MGCDAIRTSHNMPTPELVALCDEMGFMMMIEPFDEWDIAKCENGYHRYFDEWAERDMINMLHNYRNNPCVVMWSIGNEVPTQCSPVGYKVAKFLQDICHREDPTRPVTCGMDQVTCVLANGFAAMIDIPGLNYRTQRYQESYDQLPQNLILGSETASTVSSRGVYKFPVEDKKGAKYEDHQCSSYDVEVCPWSNIPDEDFALADDHHWTIGQFVWTGFDYLGEPSPYDTDSWPNHSSMFGIIDLASLPKDRYYLYRSVWNKEAETLHILPHWTWPGREGEVTPVFVYTNYPTAELFINGKSYGKQSKNNSSLKNRYRLMWMDTKYEPGEVKVVAYDKNGKAVAEKVVRTAGKPHHIELVSNRNELTADGKDLAYVTVKVVDKDGNLCPADNRQINFSVKGTGKYRAAANGDPTNLEQFHLPKMHAFNGMLTAILQAGDAPCDCLELACGSGEITEMLAKRGYTMTALDLSEEMVKQAKSKNLEGSIQFLCQDMRNLSNLGSYSGIFCLCDSFNYILEKEEVDAFFHEVCQHLKPNGLFFFDTHSLDRLDEFDSEYNETGAFEDGCQYQWSIMAEDDYVYQDFAFYMKDKVVQEHHIQRVYDPIWLNDTLSKYFDVLKVTTDFDIEGIVPGEKYFYVCRKKVQE